MILAWMKYRDSDLDLHTGVHKSCRHGATRSCSARVAQRKLASWTDDGFVYWDMMDGLVLRYLGQRDHVRRYLPTNNESSNPLKGHANSAISA